MAEWFPIRLKFYFETFSHEITKTRKDVWFFDPSTTHFLKLGSLFDHQAAVDAIQKLDGQKTPLSDMYQLYNNWTLLNVDYMY